MRELDGAGPREKLVTKGAEPSESERRNLNKGGAWNTGTG